MKRRYVLNLGDETLIAIGKVSAQWATLEYYLGRTTLGCTERFQNPESKLSQKTAFLERRNAFEQSIIWPNVPEPVRDSGKRLIDRIIAVEDKRHKIIHGMANEDRDGNPLISNSVHIIRDHPKHFFSERLSPPQISAIADEIAEINGDMLSLYFYVWAGLGSIP